MRPRKRDLSGFLQAAALAALLAVASSPSTVPAGREPLPAERALSFRHTHTDEELTVVYWAADDFVPESLVRVDRFLRDFRNDAQHEIDPELLDVLYRVREESGGQGVYHVISGYRSPETNEMLRDEGSGVARNSMHLQGRAIDVRLTGVETRRLRDVALSLELGGVGYYHESDFVHLDTGRVRRW